MGFSRARPTAARPASDALTAQMAGIGLRIAADPQVDADIEATLVHASELGLVEQDLRVLSLLTTWLGVHHPYVNADRLVRLVAAHPARRVRAYWSAVATWLGKDRRFARLTSAYHGARVELLPVGTEFQIARRGEDERFAGSKLRVPRGTLRDRAGDVLPPEELVRRHAGYRNRVLMGPTWRADVWTVLERAPNLTTAEVARRTSCSFATAWQAAWDFRLLRQAMMVRGNARWVVADADHVSGRLRRRRFKRGPRAMPTLRSRGWTDAGNPDDPEVRTAAARDAATARWIRKCGGSASF